jgi:hypothetical protein
MLTWILTYDTKTKRGWCHGNFGVLDAVRAVIYQSGVSLDQLKEADAKVRFLYRDSHDVGTYYFECSEWYPSEFYENNPTIADL